MLCNKGQFFRTDRNHVSAFSMRLYKFILILCGMAILQMSEGVNVPVSTAISQTPEPSLDSIESLVGSKIMMDSPPSTKIDSSATFSSSPNTRLKVTSLLSSPSKVQKSPKAIAALVSVPLSKTGSKLEESILSPLHVAQCRATCLLKFNPVFGDKLGKKKNGLSENNRRLTRRKRAMGRNKFLVDFKGNMGNACLEPGYDCFACWKNCQFLENPTKNPGLTSEPVVHTKQENLVKITPGKIIWPKATGGHEDRSVPVVYVVIQEYPDRKWRQIAQTTDLELEIPAELTAAMKTKLRSVRVLVVGPEGLRSVYSASTENNTEKANQVPGEGKTDKFGKSVVVAVNEETSTQTTTTRGDAEAETEMGVVSGSDSESAQVSPEKTGTMPEASVEAAVALEHVPASDILSTSTSTTTASSTLNPPAPFELRLVSLIHQKSLVIAELRWDPQGSNPNQEYLITWELTGGGLKGHLVTDSTSVTLSLWPDTTYQIQVAEFTQNLDSSEAEQDQPASSNSESSTSVKSFPLIVSTSVASFSLHQSPSALHLSQNTAFNYEPEYSADNYPSEFSEEEVEFSEENNEAPLSKNKTLAKVLCVAVISVALVLAILTLVAFAWLKLQKLSYPKYCVKTSLFGNNAGSCFSGCQDKDTNLLEDQTEGSGSAFYSSPLYYVLSLKSGEYASPANKKSQHLNSSPSPSYQQSTSGQQNATSADVQEVPVAVISNNFKPNSLLLASEASLATGRDSYCYYNNVFNFQHHQSSISSRSGSDLPFCLSSSALAPSSSSSAQNQNCGS